MLILDKQKAVERVMALTGGVIEVAPESGAVIPHARTHQRIATYERRVHAVPASPRRVAERRRRAGQASEQSPAY